MPKLFVYGTLMRGRPAHGLLAPWVVQAQAGTCAGHLYRMPAGYPALVDSHDGLVHGEVLSLRPELPWGKIDDYEGFDPSDPQGSLYIRTQRRIDLGPHGQVEADCYLLVDRALEAHIAQGAFRLTDGRWPPRP